MKVRAVTMAAISTLVVTAGCLGVETDSGGEATPPPPGSDPVISVDPEKYAEVKAAVELVNDQAFGAAAKAAGGNVETNGALLVSCPMRGDYVGQFSTRGTLISPGRENAATVAEIAKEIEAAWSELGLDPARGEDGAVAGVRVEQDVRIGIAVQGPVTLGDGSGRTARSVGLKSACLDLGEELYEQAR